LSKDLESLLFSYALKEVRSKQEETKLEVVYKVAEIGANYQPIKSYVDEETDEKSPAVKAAKTTLYAKSKLAINTWALTLKIKFARYHKKNESIEKNPAGKAAKTTTSSQAAPTEEFAVESKTLEPTPSKTTLTPRLLRRTRP
jgi:hypothetical protein